MYVRFLQGWRIPSEFSWLDNILKSAGGLLMDFARREVHLALFLYLHFFASCSASTVTGMHTLQSYEWRAKLTIFLQNGVSILRKWMFYSIMFACT